MYSRKEAQGQSEIPEGHCIKEGKLLHNRINTLIQSGICEKPQNAQKWAFFYLLVAYQLIYLIFRAYLTQSFWT